MMMYSLSHQRVASYNIAFLTLVKGNEVMDMSQLARMLRCMRYCKEYSSSIKRAAQLIKEHDLTCTGKIGFDDFLCIMANIEHQMLQLRNHLELVLQYFSKLKLEQQPNCSLDVRDLQVLMGEKMSETNKINVLEHVFQEFIQANWVKNRGQARKRNELFRDLRDISFMLNKAPSVSKSVVEAVFPALKNEPAVLTQVFGGSITQEISIRGLRVVDHRCDLKPKYFGQKDFFQHAAVIDPVFVVSILDSFAECRPDHDRCQPMHIRLLIPSIQTEHLIAWAEQIDVVISVFDIHDAGPTQWTEWIGSTRRRLSWFLDQALSSAPITCSFLLQNWDPRTADRKISVEFDIILPFPLQQMWNAYKLKTSALANPVLLSLKDCMSLNFDNVAPALSNDELFHVWKQSAFEHRAHFPRRYAQSLALDEYGKAHFLSAFLRPFKNIGLENPFDIAACVALLNRTLTDYSDTCRSVTQLETITSPSLALLSKKASCIERAIFLCNCFLGLGIKSYVALCSSEIPMVVTLEARDISSVQKPEESGYARFKTLSKLMDQTEVARLWNPSSGICFLADEEQKPPIRIHALVNHRNVWLNHCLDELPNRIIWSEIETSSDNWTPVLPEAFVKVYGYPKKCYSVPDFAICSREIAVNQVIEPLILLSDLVDAISMFRRNVLFLPDTLYHKPASKFLQQEIVSTYYLYRGNALITEEFFGRINERIKDDIQNGWFWNGTLLVLNTCSVKEIMETLEETGYLNHSDPSVRYTVAAKSFRSSWGLASTWMCIGTISKITPGRWKK